jgi:flagellin
MLSATTNTAALTAQRFLGQSSDAASSSIAKMSSGSRIVKASDDASSLAIGNKLRADIAALTQAGRNASQGASLLQVTNGALDRIGDILTRLKTLSTQVINGTLSVNERQFAQQEFGQLVTQIDEISAQTRWNNVSMLNGGDKALTSTNSLGGNISTGITGLDAANTSYFTSATAFVTAGATGEISGTVKGVTVTDIGGQYKIEIEIGNQTFAAYSDDAAAAGTELEFRSTTNDHNGFRLLTSTAAFGTAAQVETDLEDLFELDSTTTPPASLQSAALTEGNAAAAINAAATALDDVINATGATQDGIYDLTSRNVGGNTILRLQSTEGRVYEATITDAANAAGTQTVVFSNGVEITFAEAEAQATAATDLDGIRFEVTAGAATSMNFQVGVQDTDLITITFVSTTATSLGLDTLNVETEAGGIAASSAIDEAIRRVNNAQAQLGAIQSRMEYVESNLSTIIENLSAAKGIFLDVDMASEMTEFTKHQTLMQAGVSMLAQANQMPQQLLKLIQ